MTLEIPLNGKYALGRVTLIDDEDEALVGGRRWCVNNGYAYSSINGRTTYMHRLILPTPPGLMVDHINRDGLDNRRANLRPATKSQNNANGVARTGRYRGVCFMTNRWVAQAGGRYLGRFKTEREAALAYNEAALEIFGAFACLNEVA